MTILAMTKLAVSDLAAQTKFYETVLGFEVNQTVKVPGLCEKIMAPANGGGGGSLVLIDEDGTEPVAGTTLLVFDTPDIESFVDRVEASGGTITRPVERIDALGLSFAFFADPEGNVMEVLERS